VSIDRALLAQAFPDSPRLRSELESAFDLVDTLRDQADSLEASLADVAAQIGADIFQPQNALLSALSVLPSETGAVVLTGPDTPDIRPIDSTDDASLISRGGAYRSLVRLGGKGATGSRPALTSTQAAIYFDTTLAANGKPVFWTGTGWVDSTGASA
jgi:hypothetical protein